MSQQIKVKAKSKGIFLCLWTQTKNVYVCFLQNKNKNIYMNYGLSHNVEKYQFVLIGNIREGVSYKKYHKMQLGI